jgi:hypothetical protein
MGSRRLEPFTLSENEQSHVSATHAWIHFCRSTTVSRYVESYLPAFSPSMWSEGQVVKILENMKIAVDSAMKVCKPVRRPALILIFEMASPDTKICSDTRGGFSRPAPRQNRQWNKSRIICVYLYEQCNIVDVLNFFAVHLRSDIPKWFQSLETIYIFRKKKGKYTSEIFATSLRIDPE